MRKQVEAYAADPSAGASKGHSSIQIRRDWKAKEKLLQVIYRPHKCQTVSCLARCFHNMHPQLQMQALQAGSIRTSAGHMSARQPFFLLIFSACRTLLLHCRQCSVLVSSGGNSNGTCCATHGLAVSVHHDSICIFTTMCLQHRWHLPPHVWVTLHLYNHQP